MYFLWLSVVKYSTSFHETNLLNIFFLNQGVRESNIFWTNCSLSFQTLNFTWTPETGLWLQGKIGNSFIYLSLFYTCIQSLKLRVLIRSSFYFKLTISVLKSFIRNNQNGRLTKTFHFYVEMFLLFRFFNFLFFPKMLTHT